MELISTEIMPCKEVEVDKMTKFNFNFLQIHIQFLRNIVKEFQLAAGRPVIHPAETVSVSGWTEAHRGNTWQTPAMAPSPSML